MISTRHLPALRELGVGRRLAVARSARTSGSATATWTSPARSVVHMTGGVMALVARKMIGPRIGKYDADGRVNPIPAHNIPQVMLGTFILAFGWFGFNAGLDARRHRHAARASSRRTRCSPRRAGAFGAYLYVKARFGKPDPTGRNGMLAGLVAITAPCAFVVALGGGAHRRRRRRARRGRGALRRHEAQDRRPGRRDRGARRERRVGHPRRRPVRQRHVRRGPERRRRTA